MTWKMLAPVAVMLAACSGDGDGMGDDAPAAPPFPACVSIERGGVVQELVRTFDASGLVVEETLDGAPYATYTYDGAQLATMVTADEAWTFTWGADGIASILVNDAAGGEVGEYVYFYANRQLVDIAFRRPDGTTDNPLSLDWVDPYTSSTGYRSTSFVDTVLAPPLTDPLRDPQGLLMVDDAAAASGVPYFQRDVDADGVPTEERVYQNNALLETRTWSDCG